MSHSFKNLDSTTRELMLDELTRDINAHQLYYSSRFNKHGIEVYEELLKQAIIEGNESTLALSLISSNCMKEFEERGVGTGKMVKVPTNACKLLAETEFNRYYIRALCIRAITTNQKLTIYRARFSDNPRPQSELKIGTHVDPTRLLEDLRNHIGFETTLGLPEINSGLSVMIA